MVSWRKSSSASTSVAPRRHPSSSGWSAGRAGSDSMSSPLLIISAPLARSPRWRRRAQQPVPLMVAAMSRPGLAVAARHADIVGFAGLRQVPGASLGTFTLVTAAETADRVAEVRQLAGGRPHRSDVLLQQVVVGRKSADAAGEMARAVSLSVAEILNNPFALYAEDAAQAAEELRRRHALYGFDSVTTHQPSMEALGEVIAAYRNGGR